MKAWIILTCAALYGWTVRYRAQLATRVPTFCQDVKHCGRRHRVVFVVPPGKPFRAVLKHCEE